MILPRAASEYYSGYCERVRWRGKHIANEQEIRTFLQGPVRARLLDQEDRDDLEAEMRALATTDVATDALEEFLSLDWEGEPWQVGESMAECLLEEELGVQWPWNMERDKRTPKASLPGADLVGFIDSGGETLLVLGEVKTSSDVAAPPNVMTGRTGMVRQLEQLAMDTKLRWTLIKWLRNRCRTVESRSLFKRAISRYLDSRGYAVLLVGCLMRDTLPDERDLSSRARSLSPAVPEPMLAELFAWYLPPAVDSWLTIVRGSNA